MLQPLNTRVVIRRLEAETYTPGGIFLPDVSREKPSKGIVEAVGPGHRLENGCMIPVGVEVGDLVLFGKYSGTEVDVNDERFVILKGEDILAIVIEEQAKEAAA